MFTDLSPYVPSGIRRFLIISAAQTHYSNNLSSCSLTYGVTRHPLLGISVAAPLSLRQKKVVTTF